jgi:hypothetical protein
MSNSDHEQFIDEQMIELFKGLTEQNTELLRHNNQFLSKLEEKGNIIKEQKTELQIHNKDLLQHNKELLQHNKEMLQHNKELAQYSKELSVKHEEINKMIQKTVSEIEEKELLLIRLSEKYEFIINVFIFLLICFFIYLCIFQKRPF